MRHLRRFGHCLAAGALSGALVAPMQLLMWPEITIRPTAAALAFLAWSSWGALWLGLASFLVVEGAAVFAPALAVHRGFSPALWYRLAAVHGAVLAGVAIVNRDRTHQLLVSEHRGGLRVIGIAAGCFSLLMLALAFQRPPRRRPLLVALLSALALVAVAWGTWLLLPTRNPQAPPATDLRFTTSRRLLLVSLEGTDLPWILPAMERGDMPFLKGLRDGWAWGQLATVAPFSRSAALATLATGCLPSTHGVVGRRAYRLPWLTPTPVSLLLRGPWPEPHHLPWRQWQRAPAPPPRRGTLWEILVTAGRSVGLAGWPGTPVATWTVRTPLAADALPYDELDSELRLALEPSLTARPELADRTREAFAVGVGTAALAALRCAERPVDALAVNVELAARLRPLWTETEREAPGGVDVLRQAARVVDEQLRAFWLLAGGEDCLVAVVSPYGMAPPRPWRRLLNAMVRRRTWSVSPGEGVDGFVVLAGPGVRRQVRLRNTRLADITPTLLYLMELPVARDMAGRVALDAVDESFASRVPLRLVATYPPTPGHRPGPL